MRRALAYAGTLTLLALVYAVAGQLDLMVAAQRGSATLVWAPTGIALAAVVRLGYGVWPGILLGALLLNISTGHSLLTAASMGLGSTLEPLLGAFLIQRFCPAPAFLGRVRDAFFFVALVVPLCTALSALIGAGLLVLDGTVPGAGYGALMLTWWVGGALGALVVAPLLLAWTQREEPPSGHGHIIEGTALFVLLILVGGVAFGGLFQRSIVDAQSPLTFLPVPFVLWAAYRFGLRGATTASAIAACMALLGTVQGYGPFVMPPLEESLFLQQTFVGVIAIPALVLAASSRERQGAEDELRRAHDELDERVLERTADLMMANEWLEKAFAERERSVAKLRESERLASLGTLATGIAHEINNPLGAILVSAEYALTESGDGESGQAVTKALYTIVDQAERGGRIVKSVLQFARKEPTDRWENDLNQIIRTACEVLRSSTEKVGALITLDLDESLPPIRINPYEVQQVIINLLQNALDSGDARMRIRVSSERASEGVRLTVIDNGPGLSESERRRIFDPFYTTRQREGGTGLGLSIAHGIVMQHGGGIEVESELGAGTRVRVDLPL